MLCAKSRAETFELLVLNTSIIRPASNRYIRVYLERLHGAPYEPLDPVLRDTLAETFGVMVYQEDVVNVCAAFAGMPLATADGLRKSLSKKRPAKALAALRRGVLRRRGGARARPRDDQAGVGDDHVVRGLQLLQGALGVATSRWRSTPAICGRTIRRSSWRRCWATAAGSTHPFAYVAEAMRMGLTVLPPDVNASELRCTGRGRELRIGLQFVKGLTAEGAERLLAARAGRSVATQHPERVTPVISSSEPVLPS